MRGRERHLFAVDGGVGCAAVAAADALIARAATAADLAATAALLFQSINKQTIEKTVVNCFRASTSATAASRRQL